MDKLLVEPGLELTPRPSELARLSDGELENHLNAAARRKAQRLRERARLEWADYHRHLATLHERLASEHHSKAQELEGAA